MPLITQSFEDVPDSIPVIGSGIYNAEITSAKVEDNKAKKAGKSEAEGAGQNVVVEMKILNEGPFQGLKITSYIAFQNPYGKITLKRLLMSAKVDYSQGVNTDDLPGKVAKIVIEQGTYTPPGGAPRPSSNIKDYLIPTDDGYNK